MNRHFASIPTTVSGERAEVIGMVAEGDKVTARLTAEGTHKGQFMGIAPTGKHAKWTEFHEARFSQGKITEHWAVVDQLSTWSRFRCTS